jgi:imidazolonepropionase-like amidohydrolase
VTSILFKNAHVFDGFSPQRLLNQQVLVADGFIQDVSASISATADEVLDVGGCTLMPGLIDVHVHAYGSDVSAQKVDEMGEPYRTAHATRMLAHALDCGFTTVRDVGGGDWSLARAIDEGLIRAPRFFYTGKILSMTGGHGDFRAPSQSHHVAGVRDCRRRRRVHQGGP